MAVELPRRRHWLDSANTRGDRREAVLEFVDVALGATPRSLYQAKISPARPGRLGDDEADVEAEGRDLDFDQHSPTGRQRRPR